MKYLNTTSAAFLTAAFAQSAAAAGMHDFDSSALLRPHPPEHQMIESQIYEPLTLTDLFAEKENINIAGPIALTLTGLAIGLSGRRKKAAVKHKAADHSVQTYIVHAMPIDDHRSDTEPAPEIPSKEEKTSPAAEELAELVA